MHVDIKKLGQVPPGGGWRVHGRSGANRTGQAMRRRIGYSYVHSAVDDHSRLASSEIHDDEKGATAAGFWSGPGRSSKPTASGSCGSSPTTGPATGPPSGSRRSSSEEPPRFTRPYRPQTNGKVERFNRTLLEEWVYVRPYASEAARRRQLDKWLHTYNHHRCHTALGGNPPISRVNNLTGHYT